MARRLRYSPPGIPQHIIQRGNNRSICFTGDGDTAVYARYLREAAQENELAIHGWVFMTNHVHLLATPQGDDSLSKTMQTLGRRYVRYFNSAHGRSGTLFEGRFRSCLVEERRYFLTCLRYIELNPVRAQMVRDPSEYVWSSYQANALGVKPSLWTPHLEYLALGKTDAQRQQQYRALFETEVAPKTLWSIRNAVNQGLTFGSEAFRLEIENLSGRRQWLTRRGPKPK